MKNGRGRCDSIAQIHQCRSVPELFLSYARSARK